MEQFKSCFQPHLAAINIWPDTIENSNQERKKKTTPNSNRGTDGC